jgi:hypothetical protein
MLEKALRTFFLQKPQIMQLVGRRIHVGDFVPLNKTDLPAIGIEAEPQEREQMLDGSTCELQFPEFELVVKAQEFAQATAVCNLVSAALRSIPLGALICTAPGEAYLQVGQTLVVGTGTNWGAAMNGQAICFRDVNGNLIASGTVATVTSPTSLTLTSPATVTRPGLLWDLPSASLAVQLVQVDILGQWNDKEEEDGHGLTAKPRVLKIRVGWLEPIDTI